jgi:hypothetical protein
MANKTQFRPISEILSNPNDAVRLQGYIDEAVLAKQRVAELKEHIKAIKEAAKGDLQIDPKMFTFFVDRSYNNDFGVALEQLQERTDLLEKVLLLTGEL